MLPRKMACVCKGTPGVRSLFTVVLVFAMTACRDEEVKEDALFSEMPAEQTNVAFENRVVQDGENNVLNYPYYFNGGGVAVGDINNDGLDDLYFTGNQVSNKLYLNKGDFQFEDITEKAGVGVAMGWKTGVTMADVNLDGWLDIYVCRSAMADSTLRTNLLYINNGDLTFTEAGERLGVQDNSYTTHAAFFDYDRDGDVDLFTLNHSLPHFAGFNSMLVSNKSRKAVKFQSKLFRNDGGSFSDVSAQSGIINNVLSFGLGLAVSDINADGWPDLYVSNDFSEEDYLYINNGDGTFTDRIREATGHVSLYSMGSDVADINNDGLPDIYTLDMLPETNERIKLSSGDDNYDKYQVLINGGFHHQSMRNMLQLNNGNGTFSEVGQLMGISNTDWSWAALFADFDADGWKDLFVTNGYEKDYTNMQFLKFTVDEKIKSQRTGTQPDLKQIIDQMPSIQVGNFLFRNNGDLTFAKTTKEWGINRAYKSNGAAYADLDNDGDLDLVINVLNDKAVLYRNGIDSRPNTSFIKIDLKINNPGINIVGTKVLVYAGTLQQYQEYSPVRGFQSSMSGPLVFGTHGLNTVDSVRVVWPDNKTQIFAGVATRQTLAPRHRDALEEYGYRQVASQLFHATDLLNWTHQPVDTIDFKRQLLLPKIFSYSGPKIAKGDVNSDGLEDIYLCGARHQAGALFLQSRGGAFGNKAMPAFEGDRDHQDEDAVFFDSDGDGDLDLYVVSGGYLFEKNHPMLQDRLYVNDGKGNFRKATHALPPETLAGSCVSTLDIDGDADVDLFVGTRFVPGEYPLAANSLLLMNDGKGTFSDQRAPVLGALGMVCDAHAVDVNSDGQTDLIIAGEWASLKVLLNQGGNLADASQQWLSGAVKGWWNCIASDDFDGDGDHDLMVGNFGYNSQFKVSPDQPGKLVYKDFDRDGQIDPFFCYYIDGQSYPYASRDEALGQVTFLKQRYPDYLSYSNETIEKIFRKDELKDALVLVADELGTSYFENTGSHFERRQLPVQAQFSPVHAIQSFDIDKDGDNDVIMAGNETYGRVRIGKADANRGFVFLNNGKGNFTFLNQYQTGLDLAGDVRDIEIISNGTSSMNLLVTETGQRVKSYSINK